MRRCHLYLIRRILLFAMLATAWSYPDAQTYDISVIAGNYRPGSGPDSVAARCSSIENPLGTAIDAAGNLFFTSMTQIKRVDALTGVITTVLGSSAQAGFGGDGGPATRSLAMYAIGICLDAAGNIFFTDAGYNCVRRIDAVTGIVTTLAGNRWGGFSGDGGPATAAYLNNPAGLAVDSKGDIYIADDGNFRVRKIDGATGIISTIAGNGTNFTSSGDGGPSVKAVTPSPSCIAVDHHDNIYLSEAQYMLYSQYQGISQRVRRIDAATGIITTVAGNNNFINSGDNGPAVLASLAGPAGICFDQADNMYIVETDSGGVRKIDTATGIITTIAGPTSKAAGVTTDPAPALGALFNAPYGISCDATGALYVADSKNNVIRKIYNDKSTGIPPFFPNSAVAISADSIAVCTGSVIHFTASAPNAGPTPYYLWQLDGKTIGSDSSGFTLNNVVSGDTVSCQLILYQVKCPVTPNPVSNRIVVYTGPPVTPAVSIAANVLQACIGTLVVFTPQPTGGGVNPGYQWSLNGMPAGNGQMYSGNGFHNGDVINCVMTADTTASCIVSHTATSNNIILQVNSVPAPTIQITGPASTCSNVPAVFAATVANAGNSPSFQWLVNGIPSGDGGTTFTDQSPVNGDQVSCRLSPSETDCPLPSGLLSDTLALVVNPGPAIQFNPASYSVRIGQQAQLSASIADSAIQSYQWSPADSLVNASGLTPTTVPLFTSTVFQLKAVDAKGCTDSSKTVVYILGQMNLPAAFTPNGDGRNDIFRIPPNTYFTLKEMDIYDRWGVKVFSSRDIGQGWDGSVGGHPSPTGTYVYAISGMEGNRPVSFRGTVILIR